MKKLILTLTAICFAGVMQAQDGETTAVTLRVGDATMTIDPAKGGKILSLKYKDQEVISQSRWPESFGSTFWTSPQKEWNWPPVQEFDKQAYQVVQQADNRLVITSPVSQRLGFTVGKDFSADAATGAFVVTYSIKNKGQEARRVAPWEITRVPNGDGLIFFAPTDSIWPAGLMNFETSDGAAWYKTDEAPQNRKVNADGRGWLAYSADGLLLVKKFQDLQSGQPAPGEAEVQVYVNRGKTYIELESQGAYTLLQPGESLRWTVRWYLKAVDKDMPRKALMEQVNSLVNREEAYSPVTNINRGGYPRVLADGSVEFHVNAPQAQQVQIDLCGTKYDMKKGDGGMWTVTTKPLVPGFHYYFLIVDGVSVADPASQTFYGCSRWSSAIEIPENGMDDFEVQDVPHGEVRTVHYYSKVDEAWRPLMVYTPAGYNESRQAYPVVYIQHGGGEDHRGWMEQGRTAQIMDNLIAAGKAVPMIVVSSNSNVRSRNGGMGGGYNWQGMQTFRSELLDNIIPFVEKNYRVKKDRKSRAMCGLSMGGGQSFYIGLRSPEVFANVGVFSTGMFGGIRGASNFDLEKEVPGILTDTKTLNKQLDVFFMTCGEQDPRIDYTLNIVKKMREGGVEVRFNSYPGDHEWQVWRKSFHEFAQYLFK